MNEEFLSNVFKKLEQSKYYILNLKENSENASRAENILLNILNENKDSYLETSTTKYLDFMNSLDCVITNNFYKFSKTIKWTKFPVSTICFYLQYLYLETKNMEKFYEYTKMGMAYAPLNLSHRFEFIESLKNGSQLKLFKDETMKLYPNIFSAEDLSHFYRNLGFFYAEKRYWEVSFALYSISIKYQSTQNAYQELEYIKKATNTPNYYLSDDKIYSILDDFNIPVGIHQENMKLLNILYENKDNINKEFNDFIPLLSSNLYLLTKDEKYMLYHEKYNNELGVLFKFPYLWKLKNIDDSFGENLFSIQTNNNSIIEIAKGRKIGELSLREASYICGYKCEDAGYSLEETKQFVLKTVSSPQEFIRLLFKPSSNPNLYKAEYITIINKYILKFSTVIKARDLFANNESFENQLPLKEIYKAISLLKENENNKKKEQLLVKQTIPVGNKMYQFSIPEMYPEISNVRSSLYTIGDTLSIFIIENKNKEPLITMSKNWIEFNYKTSGFKPLNEMETYNRGIYEIIKRFSKTKTNDMRVYKFVIVNDHLLVFAYNYEDKFLNDTTDKIIETLAENN